MSAATVHRSAKAPVRKASPSTRSGSPVRDKTDGKKPKLRIVDKAALRRRARRRTLLTLAAAFVAAALFGVALLYGQIVEGQQDIDTMRADIARAEADRAKLERQVAIASTPDAIVQRAFDLGMVRAIDPQYLIAVRRVEAGQ
jgi:cell division protein FtsL